MSDANQRRDLAADLAEYDRLSHRTGEGRWGKLTLQELGLFAEKAYREAVERAIAAEAEVIGHRTRAKVADLAMERYDSMPAEIMREVVGRLVVRMRETKAETELLRILLHWQASELSEEQAANLLGCGSDIVAARELLCKELGQAGTERRQLAYAVYDCNGEWVRGGYDSLAQARQSLSDEELENGSVARHDGEV